MCDLTAPQSAISKVGCWWRELKYTSLNVYLSCNDCVSKAPKSKLICMKCKRKLKKKLGQRTGNLDASGNEDACLLEWIAVWGSCIYLVKMSSEGPWQTCKVFLVSTETRELAHRQELKIHFLHGCFCIVFSRTFFLDSRQMPICGVWRQTQLSSNSSSPCY